MKESECNHSPFVEFLFSHRLTGLKRFIKALAKTILLNVMLQVCGSRKPPRPSATPPCQGGEFKMKVLITKATIILSSNYHNSPPCQGGGRGWFG
jgi:hypothetical protein